MVYIKEPTIPSICTKKHYITGYCIHLPQGQGDGTPTPYNTIPGVVVKYYSVK